MNGIYRPIKRVLDIFCALLGIIGTSPIWIIAIVGILISDWGPVFYTSTRIGKGTNPFKMFKFRSLRIDRSADEASLRPDQDRIFPFGKFIRKVKIDELPQLINVLNGTMSVIGPRPVASDQKELFRVGRWNDASMVAVGLSGPAALYDFLYGDQFVDEEEYMEKVFPTRRELESLYVRKMSFIYDVKMVWWTVLCIATAAVGKTPSFVLNKIMKDLNNE